MKYNQFAIKNNKNQYIKYPTAYNKNLQYTSSLYDVHLWDKKEDAERLAEYLNKNEQLNVCVELV